MPPLHVQNINHELKKLLLHLESTFTLQWESHWTWFHPYDIISYRCDPKTQIFKLKQLEVSTSENVNWMKTTHLLSFFTLNLRAPFSTSTFTTKELRTQGKQYLSFMYTTYTNASNNTPSYNHISMFCIWLLTSCATLKI